MFRHLKAGGIPLPAPLPRFPESGKPGQKKTAAITFFQYASLKRGKAELS
jgi:hypothetical protein